MKAYYYTICLIIAFCIQCFNTEASNRIKIVTIGGGGALVDAGNERDYQQLVEKIKDYWKQEFSKVMIYKPDLIVLTETCDRPSGLSDKEQFEYFKVRKNQIQDYFASIAKENHCYLAFGIKHEMDGVWWNSCIVLDRKGKVAGLYHKNYPTIYEIESGIAASNETPVIQCDFGTVAGVICFDLNFDELRDRYAALKPDIILFQSMYHGGLEQSKWAYSCRSFFVCAYGFLTAPSEIRNPLGEVIASSTNYTNYAVATVNLDRELVHMDYNWDKLTALKKKYGDKVIISDPGKLGVVMITSEHDVISAAEMVKEFNIELLDSYFDRSRQMRSQHIK